MNQDTDWSSELKEVTFQPNDLLFSEKDESFHFYVLIEGEVEIFKTDSSGQRIQLAVVKPPTSIGEFAMIDRNPRSASARAKTVVRATMVSEAAYKKLLEDLPDWALAVLHALVQRLRQANDLISQQTPAGSGLQHQLESLEYDTGIHNLHAVPFQRPPDERS